MPQGLGAQVQQHNPHPPSTGPSPLRVPVHLWALWTRPNHTFPFLGLSLPTSQKEELNWGSLRSGFGYDPRSLMTHVGLRGTRNCALLWGHWG